MRTYIINFIVNVIDVLSLALNSSYMMKNYRTEEVAIHFSVNWECVISPGSIKSNKEYLHKFGVNAVLGSSAQ